MIAATLLLLLIPALTGDSQHIVVQRDVHVLLLHAREFCAYHQIRVLRKRVYRWSPLGSRPLLTPRSTGWTCCTAYHFVKQAVHFMVRIVETATPERP